MSVEGLASRRAALAALREVDENGAYSNLAVPVAVEDLASARDRAFASHLAYDTMRWQGTLDWALNQVLSRPLGDVEGPLRRVLRLGALQLMKTDVPARAAVSTSVELARESVPRNRAKGAGGFVNGVLRALERQRKTLPWPDDETSVTSLSLRTAHPAWVVEDLLERYPPERVAEVLAADNAPPGLTLRAVSDRDELLEELREAGVEATAGELTAEAVRVPGTDPRRLAAVTEGRARPQDEASMVVVHEVGAQPGERVLEIGAGPGGKLTHLAQQVGGEGRAVGVELHPHRARLIREAAAMVGVEVQVVTGDATDPQTLGELGPFDAVLVDAPCSDLGTGRRRPEIRWRRQPADVASLVDLQRRLLHAAADQLRPGGRLVYSVCTWTGAETVAQVDRLVEERSDLILEHQRQLLPDEHDTDGMYVARLRRRGA